MRLQHFNGQLEPLGEALCCYTTYTTLLVFMFHKYIVCTFEYLCVFLDDTSTFDVSKEDPQKLIVILTWLVSLKIDLFKNIPERFSWLNPPARDDSSTLNTN